MNSATEILDLVIRAFMLLLLAAGLYVYNRWVKTRVSEQALQEIRQWIDMAVSAAEILFPGEKRGVDKKAYVLDFLARKGIEIDADSLDVMVEAAVSRLSEGVMEAIPCEAEEVSGDVPEDASDGWVEIYPEEAEEEDAADGTDEE